MYRDPKFISVLRKKKRTADNFDNNGIFYTSEKNYIMAIIRHI